METELNSKVDDEIISEITVIADFFLCDQPKHFLKNYDQGNILYGLRMKHVISYFYLFIPPHG